MFQASSEKDLPLEDIYVVTETRIYLLIQAFGVGNNINVIETSMTIYIR